MKNSNIIDSNFLVYVAGVLVPATAISITSSFNAIPTATISMPPYPQLFGIGRQDRIPVHIFVKDIVIGEYVLLYEGTIKSFSYAASNFSREISLNTHGILSFLQDINVRFLSSVENMAQASVPGADATALQTAQLAQYFPMSLFAYGLGEVSAENLIKYPSEYLDNIINYIINGGGESAVQQVNDSILAKFYSDYSTMTALEARYSHLPHFDEPSEVWGESGPSVFPLISGMQSSAVIQTLEGILGPQGDTTVLNLVNYLVNQMEYECAFFSSPTLVKTMFKEKAGGYDGPAMVSMALKPVFFDAVPPICNVIFRSQVISINTIEEVHGVPTRVRAHDAHSVFSQVAAINESVVRQFGIIDYYPSEYFMADQDLEKPADGKNMFSSELLDTEEYTGPWVFQTQSPAWMSYVGPEAIGENIKVFKERLFKRLLMHKQFEYRTLSVSTGFNYYITPGFPGVVFDSEDPNFVFCGHVYTVSHQISKNNVSTSVELGFVRLIEDAIENPIPNPIDGVDTISKDSERMTEVTEQIIGCPSVAFEKISELRTDEAQTNPMSAYSMQFRSIVTLKEYCELLLLTPVEGVIGDNEIVPIYLEGAFTTDDRKFTTSHTVPKFAFDDGSLNIDYTNIVDILRAISEKEFGMPVYTGGSSFNQTETKSTNTVTPTNAKSWVKGFFTPYNDMGDIIS